MPTRYNQVHRDELEACVSVVTGILLELTEQEKISLASKYLHYHLPVIPIYDSISNAAFRNLAPPVTRGTGVYQGHLQRFKHVFVSLTAVGEFEPVNARTIDDFVLWWWR
jgi:hypothetical protein